MVDYTLSICKTLVLIPWMQGGGTGQQNMKFSKSVSFSSLNKQILFHKSFQHCFLVLPGSPCSPRYGSSLSCSCLSPGSLFLFSLCPRQINILLIYVYNPGSHSFHTLETGTQSFKALQLFNRSTSTELSPPQDSSSPLLL